MGGGGLLSRDAAAAKLLLRSRSCNVPASKTDLDLQLPVEQSSATGPSLFESVEKLLHD